MGFAYWIPPAGGVGISVNSAARSGRVWLPRAVIHAVRCISFTLLRGYLRDVMASSGSRGEDMAVDCDSGGPAPAADSAAAGQEILEEEDIDAPLEYAETL